MEAGKCGDTPNLIVRGHKKLSSWDCPEPSLAVTAYAKALSQARQSVGSANTLILDRASGLEEKGSGEAGEPRSLCDMPVCGS